MRKNRVSGLACVSHRSVPASVSGKKTDGTAIPSVILPVAKVFFPLIFGQAGRLPHKKKSLLWDGHPARPNDFCQKSIVLTLINKD
jgi:hypothetical protein